MFTKVIRKFVEINRTICLLMMNKWPKFFQAGEEYPSIFKELVNKAINRKVSIRVLEISGIDRPLISKRLGMIYDGIDVEYNDRCMDLYDNFFNQSIEEPIKDYYDLIISTALLEHISDNSKTFKNIYASLLESGATIHYLPSKNHPYSIILRLVGPRLQKKVIRMLRPWASHVTGYKTYFDRCSPREMENLLKEQGFNHVDIIPFYRANDYFSFFVPFFVLVSMWENFCKKYGLKQFCSGFIITAQKN